MSEKKLVSRSIPIALGIICVVVAGGLAVAVVDYTSMISGRDKTISLQNMQIESLQTQNNQIQTWLEGNESTYQSLITDMNSTISLLNSQIVNLQKQVNDLLKSNATYVELAQIILEPSMWVNKTVVVEGNLTFIGPYRSIEDLANGYVWNYEISSNGTFGLYWPPDWVDNPSYDGVNAIVIGILRATVYSSHYPRAYYIEAEKIVPL